MSRKLIYIAFPYAGEVEKNISFAIRCCRFAIRQGETPIAPHILYPQMLDDDNPQERALGLSPGFHLLEVCNELWVCGNQISHGMEGEIAAAKKLGLPIRYISEAQIVDTPSGGLCGEYADRPGGNYEPASSDAGWRPDVEADLEICGTKCCWLQLATKAEVLDQLAENGTNFVALEPIRNRYIEQHGNDLCWSFPLCMYNHLGCVLMAVREGILYLPYNSLDNETYEQFDLGHTKLLTADTVKRMKDSLLDQVSELYAVLTDVGREIGFGDDINPENRLDHEGSNV